MNFNKIYFPLLAAACAAVTIFIFQPGYLNNDAVDQLNQAQIGIYNDWHPPVMSWVWGQIIKIAPGSFGMFCLQALLYWFGFGLLISLITPKNLYRSVYLLTGFFPPLFMLLGAVVKDVLMTGAFLLGFALIVLAANRKSLVPFVLGMLILSYGMLIRHNAIVAAVPLFLYAGLVFTQIKPLKMGKLSIAWRAIFMGALFFVALFLLGSIWSRSLTSVKTYPVQQIMVHDLAGISIKLKTYLLPQYLASSEQPSMKDLRHLYNVRSIKNLFWPDFTPIHYKFLLDPAQVQDLTRTWLRTVIEYPRAYLDHRWRVFAATMGISIHKACGPYYYEETIYKPKGFYRSDGNYFSDNPVSNLLFETVEPLRESPLYWNWIYVLIPLVLSGVSFLLFWKTGNGNRLIAAVVSSSAVLYGGAYFFVSTTCDFRMVHWNVAATLVSLLFLFSSNQRNDFRS